MSKIFKDINVYFEFHNDKCYVKSLACYLMLFKGFLHDHILYCFNNLDLETSREFTGNKSQNVSPVVNDTIIVQSYDIEGPSTKNMSIWNSIIDH